MLSRTIKCSRTDNKTVTKNGVWKQTKYPTSLNTSGLGLALEESHETCSTEILNELTNMYFDQKRYFKNKGKKETENIPSE